MKKIFLMLSILAVACLILAGIGLFTARGSRVIAKEALSRYTGDSEIEINKADGSLMEGLTLQNLEIKDIKNLPVGSTLKIQKLFFNLTSFGINGVHVEIENIRLKLPDSDPIIISGTFKEQQMEINIFSNGFTVTEVLSYLPDLKKLVPIRGEANDIDIFITGHYLEPAVKGRIMIENFIYKGFVLGNAPLKFDMILKNIKDDVQLFGNVHMDKGDLKTKRVMIALDKGYLKFSGPWDQPQISLKGNAKVEKTKIRIGLTGTIDKPELDLTSEPPYSRQKLMVMLSTGKSWKSVEDSIDSGLNSAALTKDFIDYFFFAGKSSQFAKKFGISDFSVTLDQNRKGVSAKKSLSENLEVGYGVEHAGTNGQLTDVSQKLESEYKMTDQLSVGVEREMKKKQSNGSLEDYNNENNDKVLLKYKKTF